MTHVPRSNAALRIAEEDRARVEQLLAHRFADYQLVRDPTWLNDDVVEALFTIPESGGPVEHVMWVCRSGAVQVFRGWEIP